MLASFLVPDECLLLQSINLSDRIYVHSVVHPRPAGRCIIAFGANEPFMDGRRSLTRRGRTRRILVMNYGRRDIRLLVFPVRSPTTRPFLLRGSNFAHGALETEEIRTELKKSPAFVLIIAQYNSQSDSEYMYVQCQYEGK